MGDNISAIEIVQIVLVSAPILQGTVCGCENTVVAVGRVRVHSRMEVDDGRLPMAVAAHGIVVVVGALRSVESVAGTAPSEVEVEIVVAVVSVADKSVAALF